MAGTITATVTGTVGPGNSVTAGVYTNVSSITFDAGSAMCTMVQNDYNQRVSIAAATTITVVLSGAAGNYTVTVS